MTRAVREFSTEGHRLLCGSSFSPSEIARLAGVARPRVSEWRRGDVRPSSADRGALERAIGIPSASWGQPPIVASPAPAAASTSPSIDSPPALPDVATDADLAALGLDGLAALIRQFAALAPSLPPRDRVAALDRQARIVAVHERLRQANADARSEYFASPEFRRDVEMIAAALPSAAEFRTAVARLGVELAPPSPPPAPRTTPLDLDELVDELDVAEKFEKAGEHRLAAAHLLSLALDADAIALQLADKPDRTAEIFDLLPKPDATRVRGALALRLAVRDVQEIDETAREKVAELVRLLGREELAREIGGAS